jgi:hypothetical protein
MAVSLLSMTAVAARLFFLQDIGYCQVAPTVVRLPGV